jgi:hypothetical protein
LVPVFFFATVKSFCHSRRSFKSLFPQEVRLTNSRAQRQKGEGAKGVGIGKEFGRGVAIILTWVQRKRDFLTDGKKAGGAALSRLPSSKDLGFEMQRRALLLR